MHRTNTSANYQPNKYTKRCPHCPQLFTCQHNVLQHCREKHGYSKFLCPHCARPFPRKFSLYRHIRTRHGLDVHTGRGQGRQQSSRGSDAAKRAVGPRGPVRERSEVDRPVRTPARVEVGEGRVEIEIKIEIDIDEDQWEMATFEGGMGSPQPFGMTTDNGMIDPSLLQPQIVCHVCPAVFGDREDFLGHLHLSHALPYTEVCDCLECSGLRLAGRLAFQETVPMESWEMDMTLQNMAYEASNESEAEMDFGGVPELLQDGVSTPGWTQPSLVDWEPALGSTGGHLEISGGRSTPSTHGGVVGGIPDEFYFDYLNGDPMEWLTSELLVDGWNDAMDVSGY